MFLVPHVAEDAPMACTDGDASAETTPVLPQHFAPLDVLKAATGASGKLRVPSGRLAVGGAKGAPRLGVRAEAARKIAFSSEPSAAGTLVAAANAACARPTVAASVFDAFPCAAAEALPKADMPTFLSHAHILQRAQQAVPIKPRPAIGLPVSALTKQLTTPSRDRHIVAVSIVWRGGGDTVALVGSFTGWRERVPMVADSSGAHFATVHLRAGEYQYAFEVNGTLCVADEEPMCEVGAEAGAPIKSANTLLVDDGAEFEGEGDEMNAALMRAAHPLAIAPWLARHSAPALESEYSQEVPSSAAAAAAAAGARAGLGLGVWIGASPPSLPPHLAKLHGVSLTAPLRRRIVRDGPPVEWHSQLEHISFSATYGADGPPAVCAGVQQQIESESEDDNYHSGSDEQSLSNSPPEKRTFFGAPAVQAEAAAVAPGASGSACLSVTARWRTHRITTVLYTPAPSVAAKAQSVRFPSTVDSAMSVPVLAAPAPRKPACSLTVPIHMSLAAAASAAASHPRRLASRTGSAASDVSMAAAAPSVVASPVSPASPAPAPASSNADAGMGFWFDAGMCAHGHAQQDAQLPFDGGLGWMVEGLGGRR